jgi:hypothetical protein
MTYARTEHDAFWLGWRDWRQGRTCQSLEDDLWRRQMPTKQVLKSRDAVKCKSPEIRADDGNLSQQRNNVHSRGVSFTVLRQAINESDDFSVRATERHRELKGNSEQHFVWQ